MPEASYLKDLRPWIEQSQEVSRRTIEMANQDPESMGELDDDAQAEDEQLEGEGEGSSYAFHKLSVSLISLMSSLGTRS